MEFAAAYKRVHVGRGGLQPRLELGRFLGRQVVIEVRA